jgi:hypothetical protein
MKLFLRGAFALGIFAALASTALSQPPPPATRLPATPVGPAVAPATAACDPATGTVISSGRGRHFGGRVFGGRVGGGFSGSHMSGLSARLDVAGDRIDQAMQKGEERQQRFNEFLKHMAGPPVEAQAQQAGFGGGRAPRNATQPGTVVFPQHPFVRSPRDFFMVD